MFYTETHVTAVQELAITLTSYSSAKMISVCFLTKILNQLVAKH